MLDIHNLERRWIRYKIRSYFPYAAAAFSLLLLIIIGSIWLWTEESVTSKPSQPASKGYASNPGTIAQQAVTSQQSNAMVLEPSMGFVQALSENSQSEPVSETTKEAVKPVTHTVTTPPPPVAKTLVMPESSFDTPKVQPAQSSKTMLSVNRNESPLDILELERRFKETSNANLGLFIARYYYDHGEYTEAYNYALKTNAINSRIDESWIIFSKSLVKLGRIDQAKKTLQLYSSQSGSDTAKTLLDAIEKGNFK